MLWSAVHASLHSQTPHSFPTCAPSSKKCFAGDPLSSTEYLTRQHTMTGTMACSFQRARRAWGTYGNATTIGRYSATMPMNSDQKGISISRAKKSYLGREKRRGRVM